MCEFVCYADHISHEAMGIVVDRALRLAELQLAGCRKDPNAHVDVHFLQQQKTAKTGKMRSR